MKAERIEAVFDLGKAAHNYAAQFISEDDGDFPELHNLFEAAISRGMVEQAALTTDDVIAQVKDEVREEAAQLAYRVCATSRHISLGDHVAAAIRNSKDNAACPPTASTSRTNSLLGRPGQRAVIGMSSHQAERSSAPCAFTEGSRNPEGA